ncbi:hypothetical protein L6164_030073 [Bauhinia variegata]|uniref:Uncharacterized protein n=1 Tax=Bauhinia variegata TaxID=167791 RepID=A0ACB9LB94_BAUVA|nr:hypothetical protein L6164_030073 [Bauhinia variegata]
MQSHKQEKVDIVRGHRYSPSISKALSSLTCFFRFASFPGLSSKPIMEKKQSDTKKKMAPKLGTYKYKWLNIIPRKFKAKELDPPQDLKEAFFKFSGDRQYMSSDQLLRFLVEHQGEVDCTLSDSEQIIQKVLQLRNGDQCGEQQGLMLHEFIHFLFHDDWNAPLKSEVHQDMDGPLSHFFIYTGHNSYLTGNQLTSNSSHKPIKEALERGVRVIELDLWPSAKDYIKVVHGRTLTTPVPLTKCLECIKEYAFVKSDYPVIITLEDHLTTDLQAKFAEVATQIFGEVLFYPQTDCFTEFPSPESLKRKIILSTKPPKECHRSDSIKDGSSSPDMQNGSESSEDESWGKEALISRNGSDEDQEDINACDHKSQESAPEYKRLITIHGGKLKGHLKDTLKCDGKVKRLSLSEQKLKKACESHGADIVRFTQENILRIYPKGTRVQSTNFKPHKGWMYGAQMVAFNMQGHGKELWLMQGMFRANGGCGYVKKPEFLMEKQSHDEEFDPKRELRLKKTLKVKVYMGDGWSSDFSPTHFDKASPPDFYTKVQIVGVPADSVKKRTKEIMDNWSPVWNQEFEFRLTVPELALLRIIVKDKDQGKDDFAGQTCLPVSELRPGFRSFPLYDKKGKMYSSVRLLMQFKFD